MVGSPAALDGLSQRSVEGAVRVFRGGEYLVELEDKIPCSHVVSYAVLTGMRVPGSTVKMGACSLEIVDSSSGEDELEPGSREVELAGVVQGDPHPGLSHGVRMRIR